MMNEDWELSAFYWRMIDEGATEPEAIEMVGQNFLERLCGSDRNTYFFVGTIL